MNKSSHGLSDDELNRIFAIEVGKYKMLNRPPQYTEEDGRFCHISEDKFYISESYNLSPQTTEHLIQGGFGPKKFAHMNYLAKFCSDANKVLEYLNKFDWKCARHVSSDVDYFVVSMREQGGDYEIKSREEKSFCRAAVICLIMFYRYHRL